MQKDLTEVKIFQKVIGGGLFLKHTVQSNRSDRSPTKCHVKCGILQKAQLSLHN